MYKIIAFLIFLSLSFNFKGQKNTSPFSEDWKKITALDDEQKPKDALLIIKEIEQKAKKSNDLETQIKCLFYISKYRQVLEEEFINETVQDFEKFIIKNSGSIKHIAQNYLAQIYWNYSTSNTRSLLNYSGEIQKKENLENDISTWDYYQLRNKAHELFQASIKDEKLLLNTSLNDFPVLILEALDSTSIYRNQKNLFDIMAIEALEFYKQELELAPKNINNYEVNPSNLLKEASFFTKLKLAEVDFYSSEYEIINLYQKLCKNNTSNKTFFVEIDISRLQYFRDHYNPENKDSLYIETIKKGIDTWKDDEVKYHYQYEYARHLYNLGKQYSLEKPEHQFKKKEAIALYEDIINKTSDSYLIALCESQVKQIEEVVIEATLEEFIPEKSNEKILIKYKNIYSLNLNIYSITDSAYINFPMYNEDVLRNFNLDSKSLKHSNAFTLPNIGDYQLHAIELPIPKLKNGFYIITITYNADEEFSRELVQVSNLTLSHASNDSSSIYYLNHRSTGKPIKNAEIQLNYTKEYKRKSDTKSITFKSDKNGQFFILAETVRFYNPYFTIKKGNKAIVFKNLNHHNQRNYSNTETIYQYEIFTDRAIYRPGQNIYVKGICLKKSSSETEIITNSEANLLFKNSNGELISTLKIKTNEFGSFSETFTIPNKGLNGTYYISLENKEQKISYNTHTILVEEYKRPTFEVKLDTIKKEYKIDDEIIIYGNINAYSGAKISNAKVTYKITRTPNFPIWCWWQNYNGDKKEISFGETTSKEDGSFDFSFIALADKSIDKNTYPTFNYEIEVDATDINGETRSSTSTIKIAYHSIDATINFPTVINKNDSNVSISIQTRNLNGQFVSTKSELKIHLLDAPKQVFRQQDWASPDQKYWSESEYRKLFPYDVYKTENDYRTWSFAKTLLQKEFTTELETRIDLENIQNWSQGKYKIELNCYDKNNQLIKSEHYFDVIDTKNKQLPYPQLFTLQLDKETYKPGETAILTLNSSAKKLNINLEITNSKSTKEQFIQLKGKPKKIEITIDSSDFGGICIDYAYVFQNQFTSGKEMITVPYPSKSLTIETLIFRDKIKPGDKETWRFKLKNPDGTNAVSEILATMYDVSIDQFASNDYIFSPFQQKINYSSKYYSNDKSFGINRGYYNSYDIWAESFPSKSFIELNDFGYNILFFGNEYYPRAMTSIKHLQKGSEPVVWDLNPTYYDAIEDDSFGFENNTRNTEEKTELTQAVNIRKNFNETAFFYPHLVSNDKGEFEFEFEAPESLTKWKLQLLAHTKDLNHQIATLYSVTQKELMITPNFPRFFREGDKIIIECKISNLSDKTLYGIAELTLVDALSDKNLTENILKKAEKQSFEVNKDGNTVVRWELEIPSSIQAIKYKIIAQAGNFSDGQEDIIPVLTNRILVTESMPFYANAGDSKTYNFTKLINNKSTSLSNHQLTLEVSSEPVWDAILSLPYLIEYPYECAEQTFARYYGNRLAQHIVQSKPQIAKTFKLWASSDALLSELEKNQELKNILIEETPWLRDAQSETEQRKRIALLFDVNQLNNQLNETLNQLKQLQNGDGSWSWFKGGNPNRHITQHIISGFVHLKQLGLRLNEQETAIINKAMNYLDAEFAKDYEEYLKIKDKTQSIYLSSLQLQHLYLLAKSPEFKTANQKAKDFYLAQLALRWKELELYDKGLAAITLQMSGNPKEAQNILYVLKQNSIISDELGMYWKKTPYNWQGNHSQLATHSLLIEAFYTVGSDVESINQLRKWLLKNKQTNHWGTTKENTEAIFALLLRGDDWVRTKNDIKIAIGKQSITPNDLEKETGYYKKTWSSTEITPELGKLSINFKSGNVSYGALYWQYFEDLNNITFAKTPLALDKKLYKKVYSANVDQIIPITDTSTLELGDLVVVKISLKTDRDMDFVHLKDMRASCFEPIDVLSQYVYAANIGYFQTTKDVSTSFFFDQIKKGQYQFEYELRVNNRGTFSNGIATIQCMYAPEFTSHSAGAEIFVR